MNLKNILIVVDDIERSVAFYKELFGLHKILDNCSFDIEYVNPLMTHSWGQRVIRIYDPDHHVIEIGESMEYVNAKNSI